MAKGEGKGAGLSTGLVKIIMIVINIVFLLFGGLLAALGIFALIGSDRYATDSGKILENIPDMAESAGLVDYKEPKEDLKLDATVLSQDFAIAFLVVGFILFALSVEGFCGIFCEEDGALVLYAVFVGVMLLVQIACIIAFFAGALVKPTQDRLYALIKDKYKGLDDYSSDSVTWNFLMLNFECCGVDGYKDFKKAKKWKNERVFWSDNTTAVEMIWPIACCKFDKDYKEIKNTSCADGWDEDSSNFKTGCWDEIIDYLAGFKTSAIVACVIVIVFQVALILVSILLIRTMRKAKEEGEPPSPQKVNFKVVQPVAS